MNKNVVGIFVIIAIFVFVPMLFSLFGSVLSLSKHGFLIFVLLMLGVSSFFLIKRVYYYTDSTVTVGKIVDYKNASFASGPTPAKYYPEIEYKDNNGTNRKFLAASFTIGGAFYQSSNNQNLNQEVSVKYSNRNPEVAWLNTFMGTWGVPLLLFIFTALLSIGLFV